MPVTEQQIAEWDALASKLNNDSDDHMDVAQSADCSPEHTANYRHARNAEDAALAIPALIADLREARAKLEKSELAMSMNADAARKNLEHAQRLEAKLAEAEKDAKRYRWLTEDHEDPATRQRCRGILWRMPVISCSAARMDIDAAIAAQEKP